MIKRFITWIKGFWVKDISDEERERIQNEMFLERLKKNAFHERKTDTSLDETLLLNKIISVTNNNLMPEFSTASKKLADEFNQIAWSNLTDEAKKECIAIARRDFAKQSHILTKTNLV